MTAAAAIMAAARVRARALAKLDWPIPASAAWFRGQPHEAGCACGQTVLLRRSEGGPYRVGDHYQPDRPGQNGPPVDGWICPGSGAPVIVPPFDSSRVIPASRAVTR